MEWNLKLIYENFEKWNEELAVIKTKGEEILKFKGKLNNLKSLEEFFILDEEISRKLVNLYIYASMSYDKNQKDQNLQGYYGQIYGAYSQISQASSFVNSELLKIDFSTYQEWFKSSKVLSEHKYDITKLFHSQKHILDEKSEGIMANYNKSLGNYNQLYDKLAVADNSSTMVVLADGSEIEVNEGNYRGFLEKLDNQNDRQKVFEAVFKFYDIHKNTFAGIYNGIIESNIAIMKNRDYKSVLEAHLDKNNIPTEVFMALINTVKENTDVVKKYYKIRKEFFKLDNLRTYDRFLQFTKTDVEYSYDECKNMFLKSCEKISKEFVNYANKALEDGRVDVYIQDGKRTGAYSTSSYEKGPFILLNHNNTFDDAFTLAHEAGHSMHTLYANEAQPHATADYVIFVAEIASTFNEQLLLDYFMENCTDDNLKIALLQSSIDGILGTFYRQTLFANYEYEAFLKGANGVTITSEELSSIMQELYLKYYDIDLNDEKYKEFVWAYIPHFFHSPFYVYQYATSFSASLKIYDDVKNKVDGALDNYLNLLKSGGSDFPINLVKKAGVDLTQKDPFIAVVKRLEYLVDELEKLLKR